MRVTLLSGLIYLLIGCGADSANEASSENSNQAINSGDTCDCQELIIDSLGTHWLNEKEYTGVCLSYYDQSDLVYLEKNILQGKLHGAVNYYDKNGEILLTEFYENGSQKRSAGSDGSQVCNCNSLEIQKVQGMSVYKLEGVPFTGKCEKYYESMSQISMESSYENGLLNGYTIYYQRDGSTILMEKYEMGELVSTIH